jgi:exosome complex RNA-binding protein Csl4
VALGAITVAACSQAGQLGDILGSVLGGGANMVSGAIRSIDTRARMISVQQSNGQAVSLAYDDQTKVVYQNRLYAVTSLEYGDQVTARVQQLQSGDYYVESVAVTQPASTSTGGSTSSGAVQSLQGTVRQVDRTNGLFTIDAGNGVTLTVSLPYNANTTDVNKFNALRSGDYVRFYGVYVTSSRVELRQFN